MTALQRRFYFWRFWWRAARSLVTAMRTAEKSNWEVSGVQVLSSSVHNCMFFLTWHRQRMTVDEYAGILSGDLSIETTFRFIPSKR